MAKEFLEKLLSVTSEARERLRLVRLASQFPTLLVRPVQNLWRRIKADDECFVVSQTIGGILSKARRNS
jgi:hypothetical protein